MIAIFRIRFDTNTDMNTVWSDTLFNNFMHTAIPYSMANFWFESGWGNFDLSYNLFPAIVITDPNPGRPAPLDRGILVNGAILGRSWYNLRHQRRKRIVVVSPRGPDRWQF